MEYRGYSLEWLHLPHPQVVGFCHLDYEGVGDHRHGVALTITQAKEMIDTIEDEDDQVIDALYDADLGEGDMQ